MKSTSPESGWPESRSRKQRLDLLLVEQGLVASRDRAQRLIRAGKVLVEEQRIDRPGTRVNSAAGIRLLEPDHPFVSRGGLKLDGVLDSIELPVAGRVAADLGASTGGFTDCLLQRGARQVHTVDVGYGILDYRLRTDPRVVVHERTNARELDADQFESEIDLLVADLAFISLTKVLPAMRAILSHGGDALVLVKPQFELERGQVGKGGIVRDEKLREAAVRRVREAAERLGFAAGQQIESPVAGHKGNREIFLHLKAPLAFEPAER